MTTNTITAESIDQVSNAIIELYKEALIAKNPIAKPIHWVGNPLNKSLRKKISQTLGDEIAVADGPFGYYIYLEKSMVVFNKNRTIITVSNKSAA